MNIPNVTQPQYAAQEATESAAVTRAEAAKGDQQAVRKLAQQQASQSAPAPANIADSETGRLDAKA